MVIVNERTQFYLTIVQTPIDTIERLENKWAQKMIREVLQEDKK